MEDIAPPLAHREGQAPTPFHRVAARSFAAQSNCESFTLYMYVRG